MLFARVVCPNDRRHNKRIARVSVSHSELCIPINNIEVNFNISQHYYSKTIFI